MVNDPISDFLTRIKNGYLAHKESIVAPYSNVKAEISKILKSKEYITDYKTKEENGKKTIDVTLKYEGTKPAVENIVRVSKPGQRIYEKTTRLPRVLTGYGIAIISTPKGIMDDSEARRAKIGGEIICKIW